MLWLRSRERIHEIKGRGFFSQDSSPFIFNLKKKKRRAGKVTFKLGGGGNINECEETLVVRREEYRVQGWRSALQMRRGVCY